MLFHYFHFFIFGWHWNNGKWVVVPQKLYISNTQHISGTFMSFSMAHFRFSTVYNKLGLFRLYVSGMDLTNYLHIAYPHLIDHGVSIIYNILFSYSFLTRFNLRCPPDDWVYRSWNWIHRTGKHRNLSGFSALSSQQEDCQQNVEGNTATTFRTSVRTRPMNGISEGRCHDYLVSNGRNTGLSI